MTQIAKTYYQSEIGLIEIAANENGILSLQFVEQRTEKNPEASPYLQEALIQLDEYFYSKRKTFSLKLQLQGTDFQKNVWNQLMKIPYGETVSYADIAAAIGNKNATRAVGTANGKNKIPIIIPCHRVINNDGKLGGYGSGLWRKEWLLNHEQKFKNIV